MKKSVVIVAVFLFTTSMFGLEPSELVSLYRAALADSAALQEFKKAMNEHRDSFHDIKSRMTGFELLLMYGCVDSVSTTSENLIIRFRGGHFNVQHNGVIRRTSEYVENNETLILTPDQEAWVSDGHHAGFSLAPVSLKNKGKGFRIIDEFSFGDDMQRNIAYVALRNTPTPVNEEDVEMIQEGGVWKKFEREAKVSSPSRKENVSPVNIAEDEQSEKKTRVGNHWLCALIPFCALAAFWFLWRKKR